MKCVPEWLNCLIMCLIRVGTVCVWNWVLDDFERVCTWRTDEKRAALAWAKIAEDRLCHYAKSRLGELESPERENFSSRRASLAWVRVRSGFLIFHCKRSPPSESSSPKRDNSLAQARPSSLSEIPCRSWALSLFLIKWCCINWIDVIMASLVCDSYA